MAYYIWLREGADVHTGQPWPDPETWGEPRDTHRRDAKVTYSPFRSHTIIQHIPFVDPMGCELWGVEVDGDHAFRDGEFFWQLVRPVKNYGKLPDNGWRRFGYQSYRKVVEDVMGRPDYPWQIGMDGHKTVRRQLDGMREYYETGFIPASLETVHYDQLRYALNVMKATEANNAWNLVAWWFLHIYSETTKYELTKRLVKEMGNE